jgi:regulator of replication initiation timing
MSKMNKSMKKTTDKQPIKVVETASDTSDSDVPVKMKIRKPPTKKEVKKPEPQKPEPEPEPEPESDGEEIKIPDNSDISDVSEDSDEEKEMKSKKREKKQKESYKELFDKIKENHLKNIDTTKQLSAVIEGLTKLLKESKSRDKENEKLLEHLGKTHSDDLHKAANTRPKRGGKSGFTAKELPTYLFKFIKDNGQATDEEKVLANPKVLSKLNKIFVARELRNGKDIYLDKATCKDLYLDEDICNEWDLYGEDKKVIIKFEKFGKFISRLINRNIV